MTTLLVDVDCGAIEEHIKRLRGDLNFSMKYVAVHLDTHERLRREIKEAKAALAEHHKAAEEAK